MDTDDCSSPIRILIVEDHPVVRRGLRDMLEPEPDMTVIAETDSGEEALLIVESQAPDVVLLDLMLDTSVVTGLETLQRIRAISPSTHVLVLSAYSSDDLVFPALQHGAIGYMLKRGDEEEVIEAVRGAARGYYHLHPLIIQKLVALYQNQLNGQSESLDPIAPQDQLTSREHEILPLLAQGLTNVQIAARLQIARATVKTHVSNILRKLGINSRREALLGLAQQKTRRPPY